MQEKTELRKQMLAQRNAMDVAFKTRLDLAICSKLDELIALKAAKTIHAYLPMGSEIDIIPLLESLLARGVTVITPKSLKGRKLKNLVLHSLQELEDGIFGTKHPAHDEEYTGTIDLFIIPGLAFDKLNHRMGYGGGYYDNLLPSQQGYKVGVCYSFQLVDMLPTEPHDIPVDQVVY